VTMLLLRTVLACNGVRVSPLCIGTEVEAQQCWIWATQRGWTAVLIATKVQLYKLQRLMIAQLSLF
jgi:hypothetical protein